MSLALAGASEQSDRLQKESLEIFARALVIAPDPLVKFDHVLALHIFGRLDEALDAAFDLLAITPKDPLLLQVVEDITRRMTEPATQREGGASKSNVRPSGSPSK